MEDLCCAKMTITSLRKHPWLLIAALCVAGGLACVFATSPHELAVQAAPLPAPACYTFTSKDTPLTIPDADLNGITSVITLPQSGWAQSVSIKTDITHPYPGDLSMALTMPNACMSDIMLEGQTGSNDFAGPINWADNADHVISRSDYPYTGKTFKPDMAFLGKSTSFGGPWALHVVDNAGGDEGTLNSWSVTVCLSSSRPPTGTPVPTATSYPPSATPYPTMDVSLGCGAYQYVYWGFEHDPAPTPIGYQSSAFLQGRCGTPDPYAFKYVDSIANQGGTIEYTDSRSNGSGESGTTGYFVLCKNYCAGPEWQIRYRIENNWEHSYPNFQGGIAAFYFGGATPQPAAHETDSPVSCSPGGTQYTGTGYLDTYEFWKTGYVAGGPYVGASLAPVCGGTTYSSIHSVLTQVECGPTPDMTNWNGSCNATPYPSTATPPLPQVCGVPFVRPTSTPRLTPTATGTLVPNPDPHTPGPTPTLCSCPPLGS